ARRVAAARSYSCTGGPGASIGPKDNSLIGRWKSPGSTAGESASLVPGRRRRSRRDVESPTEREVEVDALHELLGLNVCQRGAGRKERELAFLHGAQVSRAHAVAGIRELQRPLVLGNGTSENNRALIERELRGQCVLHFAEGARADTPE